MGAGRVLRRGVDGRGPRRRRRARVPRRERRPWRRRRGGARQGQGARRVLVLPRGHLAEWPGRAGDTRDGLLAAIIPRRVAARPVDLGAPVQRVDLLPGLCAGQTDYAAELPGQMSLPSRLRGLQLAAHVPRRLRAAEHPGGMLRGSLPHRLGGLDGDLGGPPGVARRVLLLRRLRLAGRPVFERAQRQRWGAPLGGTLRVHRELLGRGLPALRPGAHDHRDEHDVHREDRGGARHAAVVRPLRRGRLRHGLLAHPELQRVRGGGGGLDAPGHPPAERDAGRQFEHHLLAARVLPLRRVRLGAVVLQRAARRLGGHPGAGGRGPGRAPVQGHRRDPHDAAADHDSPADHGRADAAARDHRHHGTFLRDNDRDDRANHRRGHHGLLDMPGPVFHRRRRALV
mmetsp:Transcript_75932/g.232411  ORF Transcript_75932/g.232411 Transcript_75932/m.232411 type:complete len:400 (+) Transcript_75932:424-1623(+)